MKTMKFEHFETANDNSKKDESGTSGFDFIETPDRQSLNTVSETMIS